MKKTFNIASVLACHCFYFVALVFMSCTLGFDIHYCPLLCFSVTFLQSSWLVLDSLCIWFNIPPSEILFWCKFVRHRKCFKLKKSESSQSCIRCARPLYMFALGNSRLVFPRQCLVWLLLGHFLARFCKVGTPKFSPSFRSSNLFVPEVRRLAPAVWLKNAKAACDSHRPVETTWPTGGRLLSPSRHQPKQSWEKAMPSSCFVLSSLQAAHRKSEAEFGRCMPKTPDKVHSDPMPQDLVDLREHGKWNDCILRFDRYFKI